MQRFYIPDQTVTANPLSVKELPSRKGFSIFFIIIMYFSDNSAGSTIPMSTGFDQWYAPDVVMQMQYGPIGVYFTGQDEDGVWLSITDEECQEKYDKSPSELRGEYEVWGPKLILSDYYQTTFKMEDGAIERLDDLYYFWMPYVDSAVTYPVDCVYTGMELDTIDWYKGNFESMVSEYEGLWLRDGGPTEEEWIQYIETLYKKCGMSKLLEVYQDAYNRYVGVENAQ